MVDTKTQNRDNGFPDNLMQLCLPALAVQMLVKHKGISDNAEDNLRNLSAVLDELNDAWEECCKTGFGL